MTPLTAWHVIGVAVIACGAVALTLLVWEWMRRSPAAAVFASLPLALPIGVWFVIVMLIWLLRHLFS